MTFLRSWIQGISIAAITGCAASSLAPEGRCGKGVKTAVSAMIIIMLILPFFKGDIDFGKPEDYEFSGNESLSGSYLESTAESLKNAVSKRCRNILDENGIYYKDVVIGIDINDAENTVDIKNVVIVTDYSDSGKIKKLIESETGIPAAVRAEGE